MTDEFPPWDGGPDRMLPAGAITDRLDFLEALVDASLPEAAGDDIAQTLENDALTWLAAGEVAGESRSDRGRVTLWLPFFEDQRIYVEPEQHVEPQGETFACPEKHASRRAAYSRFCIGGQLRVMVARSTGGQCALR